MQGCLRCSAGFVVVLGRLAATPPARAIATAHVPSIYDSLERRQVLSTATLSPFIAMPVTTTAGDDHAGDDGLDADSGDLDPPP